MSRKYPPVGERLAASSRPEGDCIVYTGYLSPLGYGQITWKGKPHAVHRVAYELAYGAIPKGLQVNHKCGNRACIKPEHLEAITARENVRAGNGVTAVQARQTHCHNGHPFDEANTYTDRSGRRHCRACMRAAMHRHEARRRGDIVPDTLTVSGLLAANANLREQLEQAEQRIRDLEQQLGAI